MPGCDWVQLTALLQLSAGGFSGEPNCHTDNLETAQKGAQLRAIFVSPLYLLEVKTSLVAFCLLLVSLVICYLNRWILALMFFFKKERAQTPTFTYCRYLASICSLELSLTIYLELIFIIIAVPTCKRPILAIARNTTNYILCITSASVIRSLLP
jgi:hypothetical protein